MARFMRSKWAAGVSIICLIVLSVSSVIPVNSVLIKWIVFVIAGGCALYSCFFQIWSLGHRIEYEDGTESAVRQKRTCQNELKSISEYNKKSTAMVSLVVNFKKNDSGKLQLEHGFNARTVMIAKAVNETIRDLGDGVSSDVHITMKKENKIQTVAVAYPEGGEEPTLHKKERDIGVAKGYFRDQKYFKIYEGKDGELETSASPEITEDRLEKNYNRYGQYIIYPLNYEGELFGIIGIFIYKTMNLAKDKAEIDEIANNYISHYARALELMYSVERLLLT